jgi:hypothetical protein
MSGWRWRRRPHCLGRDRSRLGEYKRRELLGVVLSVTCAAVPTWLAELAAIQLRAPVWVYPTIFLVGFAAWLIWG